MRQVEALNLGVNYATYELVAFTKLGLLILLFWANPYLVLLVYI